jgi:hypothetical protein
LIVNKEVLLIHPAWGLLFLMAYVTAIYVFFKTDGNIVLTALALCLWMIGTSYTVYWYHGIPM